MRGCKLGQEKEQGAKHLTLPHKALANPGAFYVFKFDTPETSWGHIWLPSPCVQSVFFSAPDQVRQIYLREIHLQILDLRDLFGCGDNGAGCRHLSGDQQILEEFGAKFAAIFRSRHGRGPACLSLVGLGSDFGTLTQFHFGENVRSPGSQRIISSWI